MGRGAIVTAHGLVRPAVEGFLERVEAAADRVVSGADDEEAVHDFRVALRRLRTILRASRGVYGKSRTAPLEAAAKRFGDATGALRDAEVLEDTLNAALLDNRAQKAAATWLTAVRQSETALRADARALIAGGALSELVTNTRSLMARPPKSDTTVRAYAEGCFDAVRAGVRELLPVREDDVERLHRLRIRFKRLRYTSEMLAQFMTLRESAGPKKKQRERAQKLAERYARAARNASRMQKELGLLHDADQALIALNTADINDDARRDIATAVMDLRGRRVVRSLEALTDLPKSLVGSGEIIAEKSPRARA